MKRHTVIATLQAHRERLAQLGVASLAIFGSVARDEAHPQSDLDVLVEFAGPATFNQYMAVTFWLEDTFHCRVDLVTRTALRPPLDETVPREAVSVA